LLSDVCINFVATKIVRVIEIYLLVSLFFLLLLLPLPVATMSDEDPRDRQLQYVICDGDDALALSLVRGGVDVNVVWYDVTHLNRASALRKKKFRGVSLTKTLF
jgi:hypothetical protein